MEGCQFCRANGAPVSQVVTHRLRAANGLVSCPILRTYVCPHCKATGDFAHTQSYCPLLALDTSKQGKKKVDASKPRPMLVSPGGWPQWPLPSYHTAVSAYTGSRHPLPGPAREKELLVEKHQQHLKYYRYRDTCSALLCVR